MSVPAPNQAVGAGSFLVLVHRVIQHIRVQLPHHLEDDAQAFHKAVHRHAQHAVCRRAVCHLQRGLLLRLGRRRGEKSELASDERGEFLVDCDGLEGGLGEPFCQERNGEGPVLEGLV